MRSGVGVQERNKKCDPTSFPALKDNKQWDCVHVTLKARTSYQDVADVLDTTQVPKTTKEIASFDEKQKFVCSVLERISQTDEGKIVA